MKFLQGVIVNWQNLQFLNLAFPSKTQVVIICIYAHRNNQNLQFDIKTHLKCRV